MNKSTTKNPFKEDIQEILDSSNSRDIAVDKLKKLLIGKGYKVIIEDRYLIKFKDTSFFSGSPIDINLERYMTRDLIINMEIQKVLKESNDREIIVNKLKKLLLPIGYIVTIEEEYLIQFKDTLMHDDSSINIDLEIYSTKPPEQESPRKHNPYKILGCKVTDDDAKIKNIYKALVMKYHPDYLQSKDLDESFIEFAKQKIQEINRAYDMIKEERRM